MDNPVTNASAWLGPDVWARANRELLAKALTELWYEEVIAPATHDDGQVTFELTSGVLAATAQRRLLGWWRVDPTSLDWRPAERDGPGAGDLPDAPQLLAELLTGAGVVAPTVANMVAELSATLLSDAWQLARGRPSAELVDLEPVLVESELRGHPWIVASKGRIGFDADDVLAYAPEAGRDVRLLWLAADPSIADARSIGGLDHHDVVREQVGDAEYQRLRAQAQLAGLDPDDAVYLPVHPWQWTNRILPLHAGELARGSLVMLGGGTARYRPQLAIRTLTDVDHPERRYLKLPVSVLNTSVYRGLPRERTLAAPALSEWLCGVVGDDPFLQETGVILLGEVASVSVAHPTYGALPGVPYQHTEMLGAIWREPVQPHLRPGERAVSLAALLHVDPAGTPFTGVLVKQSGLSVEEWFQRLHAAVLPPLLHVLYRYGAMFSPHGQNCMIVHSGGAPTRLVVKDFVDDVAICSEPLAERQGVGRGTRETTSATDDMERQGVGRGTRETTSATTDMERQGVGRGTRETTSATSSAEHADLAPAARAALADVTLDSTTLLKYLQNGLLICVYRYLAEIADELLGLPEQAFWSMARDELVRYQRRFSGELDNRFAQFDLETPTFPKLCLNRLRLFERGYADDAERPVISAAGTVRNPLAARA